MQRNDFPSLTYVCTSISPLSLLMQLQKSVDGCEDWKWSSLGGAVEGWEDVSQKTDN